MKLLVKPKYKACTPDLWACKRKEGGRTDVDRQRGFENSGKTKKLL